MNNTTSVNLSHKTPNSQRSFFDTGLNKACGVHMVIVKLLQQNFSSAHGHLTAENPCLQILVIMLNTSSVSLGHKPPKSQCSLNFDTGLNKACGVHLLTVKLMY